MAEKLIIDTDIGTDIDDALALAYAIKSGMDIELITTVHGDTKLRANIAKKLSMFLGKDIPVAAGEEKPIKQTHIYWSGLEGKEFVNGKENFDIKENAVDVLAEKIYENLNNVNIAAIGPMTNIAKAFQKYPDLASCINHIYIMGNAITTPYQYFLNYRAHNFKADPEAADVVFKSAVPKTIVTTEVCKKNYMTRQELNNLGGNPAMDYINSAAKKWLKYINYNNAYLYDPLVVHHHIDDKVTLCKAYNNVKISTDVHTDFKQKFILNLNK